MKILIVEDEPEIAKVLKADLSSQYVVDMVAQGKKAVYFAEINQYDLVILDLGLPDMDGIEVCKRIRQAKIKVPILVLTADCVTEDKVLALDYGADDYLTKPFSLSELHARIRALMRRSVAMPGADVITIDNLVVDINKRTVARDGKKISLRKKEFDLLEYLVRNVGRVLTRSMILEHVWDDDIDPFTNTIDVHIKYLRDHIDKAFDKKLIKTIHGLGYKIEG